MRIGVKVNAPTAPVRWATVREMAVTAEEGGLDSVWSEDHHFGPFGGSWDVWSILAGIAAVTERVEVGPIVASTNYYPSPLLLARKAATVHEMSGGRLILGLGAGSGAFEYARLGLPFDHPVGRFEEALEILTRLFAGDRFDYHGTYHHLEDAWLSPTHRPDVGESSSWLDVEWRRHETEPLDIPIMAGSLGPRMLSATLPHASGWNVHWGDREFWNIPERFAAVRSQIAAACEAVGRPIGSLWGSAEVWIGFEAATGLPIETPDDLTPLPPTVDTLALLEEAGVDHVIVLVDPQTPGAVIELAELVSDYRRQTT